MIKLCGLPALIILILLGGCGLSGPAGTPGPAWHPPIPQFVGAPIPTPMPLPPPIIRYEVVGMLDDYHLDVTLPTTVTLWESDIRVATLFLAPERTDALVRLFDEANLSQFQSSYIESDPAGVIRELNYRTIWYAQPRPIAIELRGDQSVPPELLRLEQTLEALVDEVRHSGQQEPQRIIGYFIDTGESEGQQWLAAGMDIDEHGSVYFGGYRAGVLPADEFQQLRGFFESEMFASLDRHFPPASNQATPAIHRHAIMSYTNQAGETKDLNVYSGEDVPHEVQAIFQALADIFTRYHPR